MMNYEGKKSNEPERDERETQVFAQVTDYGRKVSQLTEIVAGLEIRLQSVLRNTPLPIGIQDGKKEPCDLVPLAQEIKDSNNKMAEQINIIESIIQRLEV